MTLTLNQSLEEACAALRAAAEEAAWRVDPVSAAAEGALVRLLPPGPHAEEPGHAGFATLSALEDEGLEREAVVLAVWLPPAGDARDIQKLELCLEKLAPTGCAEPAPEDGALVRRLRRIEGQIRGLQRMLADGRECEAVMTQMSAVLAALKQTAALLVSEHYVACVKAELEAGGDPRQLNERLLNILF